MSIFIDILTIKNAEFFIIPMAETTLRFSVENSKTKHRKIEKILILKLKK